MGLIAKKRNNYLIDERRVVRAAWLVVSRKRKFGHVGPPKLNEFVLLVIKTAL